MKDLEDAEIQEKISDDTELFLEEEEPTEIVEDQGSGEKEVSTVVAEHSTIIPEISTANIAVTTAKVSTAVENLVYIRRSAEKKKDKGKGIMTEPEPEKKTKKQLEQERLRHEEALREEINKATQEQEKQEVVTEADPTHGGYKMNYFKGMKYEDIRPIFEKAWDQNQSLKTRKNLAKRKLEEAKTEYEKEKEELKAYLDLVPREEFAMEIESLATKYPIVDWKTHVLIETFKYYQIIRADGGSKNYKFFSKMLDDFDRQDVMDLHKLVEERYATSRPEGYDLMLWGDLKILFQPDEEDEVWKHQHEYNLISWRLYDSCGIHILLMDNVITIHMMIEKKYPLTQEMLSKMLSKKLKVDHENKMAFELLSFDEIIMGKDLSP
ncbi:hypothetical protein Tco_0580424 [Tanacetum coccineum]